MPRVGFEPTTPVLERAKTAQALVRAATVNGLNYLNYRSKVTLNTQQAVSGCNGPGVYSRGPGSNLGQDTDYPDFGFSSSPPPPGKCRDSSYLEISYDRSFHIPYNSLFVNRSTILRHRSQFARLASSLEKVKL
jgi:hypothetical protein